MKLIIAGSRTFTDGQLMANVLGADRHRVTQVIHGGAPGADRLGFRWAIRHGIPSRCFRAQWERYGQSAGLRRNEEMAKEGDMLVAFWDGQSPGTRHMIQSMRMLGKPVVVVEVDKVEVPVRHEPNLHEVFAACKEE